MCLILLGYQVHPAYSLVVAANRDEFHARPTAPAHWWAEAPDLLAGRDLRGGGTWMGITRGKRFAAVTNLRNPALEQIGAPSRGNLVANFLRSDADPGAYLAGIEPGKSCYNGFNLLVGNEHELWYLSNQAAGTRRLEPGIYGVSNAPLGTSWPKTGWGESALRERLADGRVEPEAVLEVLADRTVAPDPELPDTGVGAERERVLAPAFIVSPEYGTRASTVLLLAPDGTSTWVERTFRPDGSIVGETRFDF